MTTLPGTLELGVDAELEVLGEIGRGEQAIVYRARRGDTDYALKVLRRDDDRRPGAVREFYRQCALLACVDDPGLPRVHLAGTTADGRPYLVMDHLDGEPLDGRIARGRFDEPRALRLAIDLAGALGAAHAVNLVHRDVKPENILVTVAGAGRLVDFGLAARLVGTAADEDGPDLVAGTMAYCPPEQTGMLNRPVDARSDLYALGAVLFECVTGRPPYAATDVGELLHLHATAPVPDPREDAPELSGIFAEIVRRLLAKDPDDRYQSTAGLLADLRRVAGSPGEAFALGRLDGPARLAEIPLIGRDAELGRLRERWQAARAGRGGIVVLRGDSGSGKTRVAAELARYAEEHGGTVLRGVATPGDHRPLAAIRTAVDGYLRTGSAAGDRVRRAAGSAGALLQSLSPALAAVLGAPPAAAAAPEQHSAAVAALLGGLAESGPVLLHLDDVQFFDAATTRVLDRLATGLPAVPFLVVLTAREAGGPAADTDLTLPPLSLESVGHLLRALGRGMHQDPAGTARVAQLSGGNPFTVIEYTRALLDAGLLRPVWGAWQADQDRLRELALPGDAAALVLRRTGELDPEHQHVLRIAAICGARFPVGLVAAAAESPVRQVQDVMAEAARTGLVDALGDDVYAFRHDTVRAALLDAMTSADRRRWHERIAGLLGPADVYAWAEHCAAGEPGRDPARLIRASRAAAERALAEYAPGNALGYLENARAVAAEYEITLEAGFNRLLGVAYHRTGRYDDALDALQQALTASTGGFPRARTYLLIAQVQDSLFLGEAVLATARRGLAELGRPLPRTTALLLLSTLAAVITGCLVRITRIGYGTAEGRRRERYQLETALYYYGGSGAVRALRPAHSLLFALRHAYPANRLGPSAERVRSLVSLCYPLRLSGLTGAADRLYRAMARDADRIGDPGLLAYVAWMDGLSSHAAGLDDGAKLTAALTGFRDVLDTGLALDAYAILIGDHLLRGEVREAEALAERRGRHGDRSSVVAGTAGVLALRGRAGEAASLLSRFTDDAAPVHERVDLIAARMHAAVERDDLGSAVEDQAAAFDRLGLVGRDLLAAQAAYFVWYAYGQVARARQGFGDLAAARRAVARLGQVAGRPVLAGHHLITEAALLQLAGRPVEALAALDAAEPVLRRLDSPLHAYEKAVLSARCHAELAVPGEAGRQARVALEIAGRAGWPHRARRVADEFGLTAAAGPAPSGRSAALEQVGLAASRVLEPAQLTRIALDETIRLLGAERAFLFLADPATGLLEPYAGRDADGGDLRELSGYSTGAVEEVRHTREPMVFTGGADGTAIGSGSIERYGLRSILGAPVRVDERLLGVVYLDSRVAKGVFTVDDVDLLTAVAHHIAVALETARSAQLEVAVAAANRQRDLAETLRAAMARFSALLDPESVLRELLTTALSSPGGDRGWVIFDGALLDGGPLPAGAALDALLDIRSPRLGGGSWTGLLSRTDLEVGSWLAVPLETRTGPAGVLVLAAGTPDAWIDADLGLVAALAGQAMAAYENARLFSRVNELATTDSLTRIANRRSFFEQAGQWTAGDALMIDIDHFKKINDTYGHQAGDDVIQGVVARLVHPGALIGRYGGEEFAILVPGATGLVVAEQLRAAVADTPIPSRAGPIAVTISVGVAHRQAVREEPDALLGRADAALYAAKQGGRNRVVAHQP